HRRPLVAHGDVAARPLLDARGRSSREQSDGSPRPLHPQTAGHAPDTARLRSTLQHRAHARPAARATARAIARRTRRRRVARCASQHRRQPLQPRRTTAMNITSDKKQFRVTNNLLAFCAALLALLPATARAQSLSNGAHTWASYTINTGQELKPAVAIAAPVAPAVAVASNDERKRAPADDSYRIGPGDVLEVRVFNRPQLSRDSVRVDQRGAITMPMIDEQITAVCLTEAELAAEIAKLYLKYQRNPHVDVFIKEFNSRPVAVMGAVEKPGQFQLQRRARLLELLSLAGGPSERA